MTAAPDGTGRDRWTPPRRLTWVGDRLLPVWFLAWSAFRLWQLGFVQQGLELSWLGRDFRIYRNAAVAAMNGTDPWAAFDRWNGTDWHFAALPTSVQLSLPFAYLPEWLGLAIVLAASVGAAVLALRRLHLPVWWLLFPPMMEGLAAANPQILVFALLVLGGPRFGGPIGRAVAVGLKVYAIVPVVARREWRALGAVGLLFAASFVTAPNLWASYLRQFSDITRRVAEESQGGVSAAVLLDPDIFGRLVGSTTTAAILGLAVFSLVVLVVVVAALRDVRSAGWVSVPLLWPASEYHYATFSLPVARRASTWIIAIPTLPTYLVGLLLLTWEIAASRPAIAPQPDALGLAEWIRRLRPARGRDSTSSRT